MRHLVRVERGLIEQAAVAVGDCEKRRPVSRCPPDLRRADRDVLQAPSLEKPLSSVTGPDVGFSAGAADDDDSAGAAEDEADAAAAEADDDEARADEAGASPPMGLRSALNLAESKMRVMADGPPHVRDRSPAHFIAPLVESLPRAAPFSSLLPQ